MSHANLLFNRMIDRFDCNYYVLETLFKSEVIMENGKLDVVSILGIIGGVYYGDKYDDILMNAICKYNRDGIFKNLDIDVGGFTIIEEMENVLYHKYRRIIGDPKFEDLKDY